MAVTGNLSDHSIYLRVSGVYVHEKCCLGTPYLCGAWKVPAWSKCDICSRDNGNIGNAFARTGYSLLMTFRRDNMYGSRVERGCPRIWFRINLGIWLPCSPPPHSTLRIRQGVSPNLAHILDDVSAMHKDCPYPSDKAHNKYQLPRT